MFGETPIFHVKVWNHPIETIIKKWSFRVPGISKSPFFSNKEIHLPFRWFTLHCYLSLTAKKKKTCTKLGFGSASKFLEFVSHLKAWSAPGSHHSLKRPKCQNTNRKWCSSRDVRDPMASSQSRDYLQQSVRQMQGTQVILMDQQHPVLNHYNHLSAFSLKHWYRNCTA